MLFIGPVVVITNGKKATLMVASDSAGDVTITIPDIESKTVTIGVSGKASFECTFEHIGVYTVTAIKGSESDTTVVYANTDKCLVYGTIVDILGNPLRDKNIIFKANGVRGLSAWTDHKGYFSVPLLRGIEVIIYTQETAYKKQVTIPDANSADIKDL